MYFLLGSCPVIAFIFELVPLTISMQSPITNHEKFLWWYSGIFMYILCM